MIPFRSPYVNPAPRCQLDTGTETQTKQEFKDECDINRIMRKYQRHGVELPAGLPVGTYGDFSRVTDYREAQDILLQARAQFDALPAKVRDRFQNEPANLLAFVSDAANLEEARSLGLLREEVTVTTLQTTPVTPPAP